MLRKLSLFVVLGLLNNAIWAYGTGQSMYPMLPESKFISTEVTGLVSNGKGMGIQARYTQKLNPNTVFDAGLGIAGGERDSRVFAGVDYEIFPDYGNQPRVSAKLMIENAREFEERRNIISIAPTVSKGFSFWGTEAYPFVSLPFGVNLNYESGTYKSQFNINAGVSGNLPIDGYRKFVASLEGSVNIKDSYSGLFLGLSYPLN